jgi:ankyrin repeat protein
MATVIRDCCDLVVEAAEKNDVKQMLQLIKDGADVDLFNSKGQCALSVAAYNFSTKMVGVLLSHQANVNPGCLLGDPLNVLCRRMASMADEGSLNNRHWPSYVFEPVTCARLLIESKADCNLSHQGWTPLSDAVMSGHLDLCRVILPFAQIDLKSRDKTPLWYACDGNYPHIVPFLLQAGANPNDMLPLQQAIYNRSLPIIRNLIEAKVDVNIELNDGNSPLSFALQNQESRIFDTLLEAKANIEGPVVTRQGKRQRDYLYQAICSELPLPFMTGLIHAGAQVDRIDPHEQQTPLMLACRWGMFNVVQLLLKFKANTEIMTDRVNYTPLMLACANEYSDMVAILLEAGANTETRDNQGKKALDYTSWFGACRKLIKNNRCI